MLLKWHGKCGLTPAGTGFGRRAIAERQETDGTGAVAQADAITIEAQSECSLLDLERAVQKLLAGVDGEHEIAEVLVPIVRLAECQASRGGAHGADSGIRGWCRSSRRDSGSRRPVR